jgi:hypothetical protein
VQCRTYNLSFRICNIFEPYDRMQNYFALPVVSILAMSAFRLWSALLATGGRDRHPASLIPLFRTLEAERHLRLGDCGEADSETCVGQDEAEAEASFGLQPSEHDATIKKHETVTLDPGVPRSFGCMRKIDRGEVVRQFDTEIF